MNNLLALTKNFEFNTLTFKEWLLNFKPILPVHYTQALRDLYKQERLPASFTEKGLSIFLDKDKVITHTKDSKYTSLPFLDSIISNSFLPDSLEGFDLKSDIVGCTHYEYPNDLQYIIERYPCDTTIANIWDNITPAITNGKEWEVSIKHTENDTQMRLHFCKSGGTLVLLGYCNNFLELEDEEKLLIASALSGSDYTVDLMMPLYCDEMPVGIEPLYRNYLEPSVEYNYIDVMLKHFEQAKQDGLKTVLTMEVGEGLPTALSRNLSRSKGYFHLNLPYFNIEQFKKLNIPNKLTNPPQSINLDRLSDIVSDEDAPIDFYCCAIMQVEKIPFFNEALIEVPNRALIHSLDAVELELNRDFGKRIASAIGLKVPVSVNVQSADDWINNKHLLSERVAVKFNKRHFIGIFDKDSLTNNIDSWLSAFKDDYLVVEDYITTSDREINLSYIINEDRVSPMMMLCELNKILENNTGGKAGNTVAVHDTRTHLYQEYFDPVTKALTNLHKHVNGLNGWVDLSFMINEQGEMYFTEWCIRMGCSNNASIVNMMQTPLPEALSTGKVDWAYPVSVSTDIFSILFGSGNDVTHQVTDNLCKDSPHAFFDPLDSAYYQYADSLVVFGDSRYGVVTGCANDFDTAYSRCLKHLESLDILGGGYRKLNGKITDNFPFLKE